MIGKNNFHIEWVSENIRSHKKYFYALQNTRDIIITVDDDMYYSDEMVSTLMQSYQKHPSAISARRVRLITKDNRKFSPYFQWEGNVTEYVGIERMDLCAIGVSGILYPPGCRNKQWFDVPAILKYAHNQDDLWLKFNQIIDQIPVVYTGMEEMDRVIEGSQNNALCMQNVDLGENDISVKRLSEQLKKKYPKIYNQWFNNLMQTDEMISAKREFYKRQLTTIFKQQKDNEIYICGAGKYAHILYDFVKSCGKQQHIKAFLVSQKNKTNTQNNEIEIKELHELNVQESFSVLCGVGRTYRQEFKKALEPYQYHKWLELDLQNIERLLYLESKTAQ
ncbi:MAG: hypothetical protein K2O40_03625 [Lachnospiraceae bacterium]|nr:hypothetical protein [Lachnospiraceae bacterium]